MKWKEITNEQKAWWVFATIGFISLAFIIKHYFEFPSSYFGTDDEGLRQYHIMALGVYLTFIYKGYNAIYRKDKVKEESQTEKLARGINEWLKDISMCLGNTFFVWLIYHFFIDK